MEKKLDEEIWNNTQNYEKIRNEMNNIDEIIKKEKETFKLKSKNTDRKIKKWKKYIRKKQKILRRKIKERLKKMMTNINK